MGVDEVVGFDWMCWRVGCLLGLLHSCGEKDEEDEVVGGLLRNDSTVEPHRSSCLFWMKCKALSSRA